MRLRPANRTDRAVLPASIAGAAACMPAAGSPAHLLTIGLLHPLQLLPVPLLRLLPGQAVALLRSAAGASTALSAARQHLLAATG